MEAIIALSTSGFIEKYGAYAGLAAIPGLAVLSLLYFAQAREVRRLRDWAGRAPERDIAIEVVGRRPGEKLHEELFNPYEHPQPTPAEKILLAACAPSDPEWVAGAFEEVNLLVLEDDAAALAAKVSALASARAADAVRTAP